jgi:hypothetical protein
MAAMGLLFTCATEVGSYVDSSLGVQVLTVVFSRRRRIRLPDHQVIRVLLPSIYHPSGAGWSDDLHLHLHLHMVAHTLIFDLAIVIVAVDRPQPCWT